MLDEKEKWQFEQYNNLLNIETDLTVLLQKVEAMRKRLTPNQPPQKTKRLTQKEKAQIAINKVWERQEKRAAKIALKNN